MVAVFIRSVDQDESSQFGCLSSIAKKRTEKTVVKKGILRLGFALDYIVLEFESLSGAKKLMTKLWKIKEIREPVTNGTIKLVSIPDPEKVTQKLLK